MTSSTKRCTKCKEEKLTSEFSDVSRRSRKEKHPWCRECLSKYQAEQYQKHKAKRDAAALQWRKDHPERVKELANIAYQRRKQENPHLVTQQETLSSWRYRLKKQGLTPKDYYEILQRQNYRCAICLTADPGKHGKFHADHCHTSGRSRGLLCNRCNGALGLFQDNPDILRRAIEYLKGVDRLSPTPVR